MACIDPELLGSKHDRVTGKALAVFFLAAVAAMTGRIPARAENEQPAATALPNPAAVFCVENGGTYEIRRAGNGSEIGICILADGTEVDAWAYFREQ